MNLRYVFRCCCSGKREDGLGSSTIVVCGVLTVRRLGSIGNRCHHVGVCRRLFRTSNRMKFMVKGIMLPPELF